jgi:Sulfatase-modifying factor enzyme 1
MSRAHSGLAGQFKTRTPLASLVAPIAVVALACGAHPEADPKSAASGGPDGPPRGGLAVVEPAPLADPTPRLAFASVDKGEQEPGGEPAAASSTSGGPCPAEMILVEGEYCTEVRQTCLEWMEPPDNKFARCAKFAPSECTGKRVHMRFCVDRDEYAKPGDPLPEGDTSWVAAKATCEGDGKRLCLETEWQFACEGPDMLPYPYGLQRDASRCNHDRGDLIDPVSGKLRDYRMPASELEHCTSPFGVRNMTGNVDEWVVRDWTGGDFRSALKGGWWMPARNRCRPATTAHGELYQDVQTGFRCCKDSGQLKNQSQTQDATAASTPAAPSVPVASQKREP